MARERKRDLYLKKASRHRGLLRQCWDLIVHKLRLNIGPLDYYDLELYRGRWSWEERSRCIADGGSRYWPYEGNSLKDERLFARKGMQKALLQGLGLPTPRLLGLVGADYPVSTREAFAGLLAGIDRPFMLKPDGSLGGHGVMAIEPADGCYRCGERTMSADELWDACAGSLQRGLVVEERVRSHPDLEAFHPASLNTLRIIAIQTRDRRWHTPQTYLRCGRGGAHADNSTSGGLMTLIRDGVTVGKAWECHIDQWFDTHPDTGVPFAGLRIPMYEEALALVRNASRHFGFMRTIGWDVAITPDGPMLIEANAYWNPKRVQILTGPILTPEIVAGLQPRAWYTPWDRTHMHPHYRERYAGGPLQRWHARRRKRFADGD